MNPINFADFRLAKVHLIGIGGSGMSGIARILVALDIAVSGSDIKDSQALQGLRKLGWQHLHRMPKKISQVGISS